MILAELRRIRKAFGYSLDGLVSAFRGEAAFRIECVFFVLMMLLAIWLPVTAVERALLIGSLWLVLIVEMINSAIENAVDHTSLEKSPLAKNAKDMGSAAVLLSLLNAATIWLAVLWPVFVQACGA